MRRVIVAGLVALMAAVGASVAGSGVRGDPGGRPVATHPRVVHATPTRTRRLRDLPKIAPRHQRKEAPDKEAIRKRPPYTSSMTQSDPAVQSSTSQRANVSNLSTWEGLGGPPDNVGYQTVVPPDPNGEVGATQYLEMVNSSLAVYDKDTGAKTWGPYDINTLWAGKGGVCETQNMGDPIVVYDQVAQRWVISQFAFALSGGSSVGPYYECVAVSTSSDATGTWNIYSFQTSTHLMDDYPKLAVWPDSTNDMYAMTYHTFDDNTGGNWAGGGFMEMDREEMIAGGAATILVFDADTDASLINIGGQLPSDFNGDTLPPDGSPLTVVMFDDDLWGYPTDQLELFDLTVDWTAGPPTGALTAQSTSPLVAAPFSSSICTSGGFQILQCIRQPGVTSADYLDSLSDRLMFRADYLNIGGYEHLVINHTVNVSGTSTNGRSGIRWYDLRKTAAADTTWSIYQQSTFAPADTLYRWMGSIAMDGIGDVALGYSSSGGGTGQYPGIRYTTRLWSDPLSKLRTESVMYNGQGTQVNSFNRWGDYSDMTVDPVDRCTFYYVNEYLPSGANDFDWRTRIGKFSLPECTIGATSFVPLNGLSGTTVTITGSGFAQGATAVSFNGTDASDVTVTSPTSLTAVVPDAATTGPIAVTGPTGSAATTADFLVQAAPPPKITSLTPLAAAGLASVTISGTSLAGATEVDFNGTASPLIVSSTSTKIVAQVPVDATNGPITVTTPNGTSPDSTAIFKPLPRVTGFTGEPAQAAQTVTVNGYDFTSNIGTPTVKLGTTTVVPSNITATSFDIPIPDAAVSAKVSVFNGNGTATSLTVLHIRPTIDLITPVTEGIAGTVVTLTGQTFKGTTRVVDGTAASFKVLDNQHLRVTIPAGAVTGPITVTNAGGSTDSPVFTVDPKLKGVSPWSAPGLASVSLTGTGLAGATDVTFNGTSTPLIVSATATKVVAQVPADATNGAVIVTTPAGTSTMTGTFKPLPKVVSFDGEPVQVDETVTVHGYDFISNIATPVVKLGSVLRIPAAVTGTSFTFDVQDGALSAKVSVGNGNGTGTSLTVLHIRPRIDSLSVTHGVPGSYVTLTGMTFTGTNRVTVGGVPASYAVVNYHTLKVKIPAAAVTGAISVRNAGGTTDSAVFTVD